MEDDRSSRGRVEAKFWTSLCFSARKGRFQLYDWHRQKFHLPKQRKMPLDLAQLRKRRVAPSDRSHRSLKLNEAVSNFIRRGELLHFPASRMPSLAKQRISLAVTPFRNVDPQHTRKVGRTQDSLLLVEPDSGSLCHLDTTILAGEETRT